MDAMRRRLWWVLPAISTVLVVFGVSDVLIVTMILTAPWACAQDGHSKSPYSTITTLADAGPRI